jgi:diadenosine tetraphosphate (Ap4A) HIT family hydrolase
MEPNPTEWMPRDKWDALVRGEDCPLCAELQRQEPENEFGITICNLPMSKLRLVRNQYVPGYCVLICNRHVHEPYELSREEGIQFFEDMNRVGAALERVLGAIKMNFEILGNLVPHLHVHIKPRFYGDDAPSRPIWPDAKTVLLSPAEYAQRVQSIRTALNL